MDKVIQLRHRNRQLLLLCRQTYSRKHLRVRNKHRRHQLFHIVAPCLLQQDPDLIVNPILIPTGNLLTLGLKRRQTMLPIGRVPRPHHLEPRNNRRNNHRGQLLRVLRPSLRIRRDVFHFSVITPEIHTRIQTAGLNSRAKTAHGQIPPGRSHTA